MKKYIKLFWLVMFYGIANHLPDSYSRPFGKASNWLRIFCCRHIFKYVGPKVSNINRNIYFGKGQDICIGDYSSIGSGAILPNNIVIGKYVMMGPNLIALKWDHRFERTDIPMCFQGAYDKSNTPPNQTVVIGDDVWIGYNVIINKKCHIGNGCILAAGANITKDVPDWAIVGGNPAKVIRMRKELSNDN